MTHFYTLICLFILVFAGCSDSSHSPNGVTGIDQSLQLVVVKSADWNLSDGILYTYERKSLNDPWKEVLSPFPVVLGINGLAWGVGLQDYRSEGKAKVEGDKKSPAGIFSLSSAFGYRSGEESGVLHMPYQQITVETRCIEDSKSAYYNQIVEENNIKPDWESADRMAREDNLYSWGIFIDHNTAQEAESGSCIFMHVWRGPDQGTLGCTAMDQYKLQELIFWLRSSKNPLLVQLPKIEYLNKQDTWHLPAL